MIEQQRSTMYQYVCCSVLRVFNPFNSTQYMHVYLKISHRLECRKRAWGDQNGLFGKSIALCVWPTLSTGFRHFAMLMLSTWPPIEHHIERATINPERLNLCTEKNVSCGFWQCVSMISRLPEYARVQRPHMYIFFRFCFRSIHRDGVAPNGQNRQTRRGLLS